MPRSMRRSNPRYFKNSRMLELFKEIEVVVTKENSDAINEIFHDMLSVDFQNDAATWKQIRLKLSGTDSAGFKKRIKQYWERRKRHAPGIG